MISLQAECVVDGKNSLGEGPVWDDKLQELFWVDINGQKLLRYNPATGHTAEYGFDKKIGFAVPSGNHTWVLGLEDGFYRFNTETGSCSFIVHTGDWNLGNRLNDGKCDPAGRIWCGTISGKGQTDGYLYVLESGGKLDVRLSGVNCSNGLAWNADATTMYYIDSGERVVHAFDYDASTGSIANRRAVIHFPQGEIPDGMSIDSEGMLWIGHWEGGQIGRWNPETGEQLVSVKLPVRNVTSCAFGGPELNELYITTAMVGNDGWDMKDQPLAGGLFRVRLDVKGMPVHRAAL